MRYMENFISYWALALLLPFVISAVSWSVFQILGDPLASLGYWTIWGAAFFGTLIVRSGNLLDGD